MPLYDATDADYNASYREILSQIAIYFDSTPTIVTSEDYIVDWNLLEELGAEVSNSPIGQVSANAFSFSLLNESGRFNPSNPQSPYFGKMRKGIKVIPSIRTRDTNWIQLGVFFVDEWNATVTGLEADISCYDYMNTLFKGTAARSEVKPNVDFDTAFAEVFQPLNVLTEIDESLEHTLDWWYTQKDTMMTLQMLNIAAMAACFCERDNKIIVRNMRMPRSLRTSVRDTDQLVSATIATSLTKEYDGSSITINRHQLTELAELLTVKELPLSPGFYDSPIVQFTKTPVIRIEAAALKSVTPAISLNSYITTPYEVSYTLKNANLVDALVDLSLYGRCLEITKSEYSHDGEKLLTLDNVYVQTEDIAESHKTMLDAFVTNDLPYLDITIRGNPLLKIGDKIRVESPKYGIDFTGYILRNALNYTGTLDAQLRLINYEVLEVT